MNAVFIQTKRFIIGMLLLFPLYLWGQSATVAEKDWADSMLVVIEQEHQLDYATKEETADSIFRIWVRDKNVCKQIIARVEQAVQLDNLGKADSALKLLYWAQQAYTPDCDSLILMSVLSNLTNIYLSLGELSRIDSVSNVFFKLWNPEWTVKDSRFSLLNNLAISYAYGGYYGASTTIFHQAYQEALLDHNDKFIEKALINLGSIKGVTNDLDSAYYFLNTAVNNAKRTGDLDTYMTLLINLANVDMERGKHRHALSLLDSVYVLADTLNSTENLAFVQRSRAKLYEGLGDFEKANTYLNSHIKLSEEYLDEERVKAVTEMMEKYESEKKVRQIQQLELDKLDASLKTERLENTRNRYLSFGIVILLTAIGIGTRLQYVNKSREAIRKEKDISEGLLLNILPAAVAEELKMKGHADTQHFDLATILFSDFKGFTSLSETLSPTELVEELNYCFKAFDHIMTKYNIEKIKTIGDAYMAAGAIPHKNTATALDVVLAAIEMQEVIKNRKLERAAKNLTAFEMRLGIHSGPVVAGIVGVKKFQYDIWGDTVNIASRLETNGEVGQVNISETTYNIVKDDARLKFYYRGLIEAKGKGEIPMYFVERV